MVSKYTRIYLGWYKIPTSNLASFAGTQANLNLRKIMRVEFDIGPFQAQSFIRTEKAQEAYQVEKISLAISQLVVTCGPRIKAIEGLHDLVGYGGHGFRGFTGNCLCRSRLHKVNTGMVSFDLPYDAASFAYIWRIFCHEQGFLSIRHSSPVGTHSCRRYTRIESNNVESQLVRFAHLKRYVEANL